MASLVDELNGVADTTSSAAETTTTVESPAQDTTAATTEAAPAGETHQAATTDSEQSLLDEVAKAEGLDLQDPGQRAFAEKLTAREQKIRDLQAAQASNGTEDETLTEYERQMLAANDEHEETHPAETAKPQATQQQAAPQGEQRPGPVKYGDIGDNWNTWQDAHEAEGQEYGQIAKAIESGLKPDYSRLNQIQSAKFTRWADNIITPWVNRRVAEVAKQEAERIFQERVGSVMPQIQETIGQQRSNQAIQGAITDLEKTKGFEGVRDLYKKLDGPESMDFKDPETGQMVKGANNRLNQILSQNPWILYINRQHADPAVAERLSQSARLKAVMKLANSQTVSPKTAQSLMAAGAQAQQKAVQDRTRQTLNAGTEKGNAGKGAPKGFVDELNEPVNGSISFSSVFR